MLAQRLAGHRAAPATRQARLGLDSEQSISRTCGCSIRPRRPALNSAAGACITCPRRSGYNTSLFADVADGDQCLDGSCYQIKLTAHIDREVAARPELIQIENGWRNAKEQRPGGVQRGVFREIETVTENPDAEPAPRCAAAQPAIIVYGKRVGTTITVCTDNDCPVHDPRAAAAQAANPAPTMAP